MILNYRLIIQCCYLDVHVYNFSYNIDIFKYYQCSTSQI